MVETADATEGDLTGGARLEPVTKPPRDFLPPSEEDARVMFGGESDEPETSLTLPLRRESLTRMTSSNARESAAESGAMVWGAVVPFVVERALPGAGIPLRPGVGRPETFGSREPPGVGS